MGMDVYGKAPTAEVGTYFRNNVWWWSPLWTYCEKVAPDIIPEDNLGHTNDGWGLGPEGAEALAARLMEEIESGRTAAYERAYNAWRDLLPRERCRWCSGTGVRTDPIGVANGMPERENLHTGGVGWCNGCDGLGSVEPIQAMYLFSVANVREFARFLRASGGFEIH